MRTAPLLVCAALAAACSDDPASQTSSVDAAPRGTDAAPPVPDAAPPQAPGPITVQVVDRAGQGVAGLAVVFHDAEGQPLALRETASDGTVRDLGVAVTVADDRGPTPGRQLRTALAVPADATVRFRSERGLAPTPHPLPANDALLRVEYGRDPGDSSILHEKLDSEGSSVEWVGDLGLWSPGIGGQRVVYIPAALEAGGELILTVDVSRLRPPTYRLTVRHHLPAPLPEVLRIDVEASVPWNFAGVERSAPMVRPWVTWRETGPVPASRFVAAELRWVVPALGAEPGKRLGLWKIVAPVSAGSRIVVPALPDELAAFRPYTDPRTELTASVTLADDDAVTSYAGLLAGNALETLEGRGTPRATARRSWSASAAATASVEASGPQVVRLTSDPPTSDGRLRVPAGSQVTVTADAPVRWSTRGPFALVSSDATRATLQAAEPGQTVRVFATRDDNPAAVAELSLEAQPASCLDPWPPIVPPEEGQLLRERGRRLARRAAGLHRASRPPATAHAPRAGSGGRDDARGVAALHARRPRHAGGERTRARISRRAIRGRGHVPAQRRGLTRLRRTRRGLRPPRGLPRRSHGGRRAQPRVCFSGVNPPAHRGLRP